MEALAHKEARLKRAAAAQAEARLRRQEIEAEQEANIARWLEGTVPLRPHRAASALERQHKHRESARELGELPRVRHRRVREACRLDLLRFGLTYGVGTYFGMVPMIKRAPSKRMEGFIRALQDKIINGGLKHVRWPRGKGKSTWVKIAIMWGALYRHQFFFVVVEQTKGMAKIVVDEIWKRIYLSPRISADFPEFAVPMRDVELAPQRMRSQTYHGVPTYMKQDVMQFNYYKLPTMEGYANTGAIIAFRGADQSLLGINIESARPNFFFIDDPQDKESARNPATVKKIVDNITGAVLGTGDLNATISAVMASTPIEPDDVSETFANAELHPEWNTETECLVIHWGPKEIASEYIRLADRDEEKAHRFYVEHREKIESGVEMMDDGDFDPSREVSAYEHALNLMRTQKENFYANYQMTPARSQGIYKLSPKMVRERVNGCPSGIVPHECDQGALAFVDVNETAGLRWEICAFGKGRIAAILAYGQYPAEGERLYPKGIPESSVPSYLAPAIREVASVIMGVELKNELGEAVKVRGICFDGGWMTACVAGVVQEFADADMAVTWSKGYDSKGYSIYHHEQAASGKIKGIKAAENCHTWVTSNGKYLAFNSDYWKEISQTSFLAAPLTPSSSSLYGSDQIVHYQFAQEVCNEELKAKEKSTRYGTVYTWKKERSKPNHYGDVHAGVLAFGAIRGNFDPIASVISAGEMKDIAKHKKKVRRYVYQH